MQVIVLNENASGEYERPKGESVTMEGGEDENSGFAVCACADAVCDNGFME